MPNKHDKIVEIEINEYESRGHGSYGFIVIQSGPVDSPLNLLGFVNRGIDVAAGSQPQHRNNKQTSLVSFDTQNITIQFLVLFCMILSVLAAVSVTLHRIVPYMPVLACQMGH